MTLKAGDVAPDFTLPDHHGEPQTLSKLLTEGPVVLFFYPQANTPGCTVQACHFRDLAGEFEALGAQIVGISRDSVEAQAAFADKRGFGYPLLADTDRAVAEAYGVKGGMLGLSPVKRSTFVIGTDGIVLGAYASETNMNAHADRALAALGSPEPA
ncbi:MAG TPA: peroxiredoxin [Mycobacteriales bacterium]|nr:peroxiredoxin [Mycobacteriales bacterium]